jgi:PTS system mannose-specific IID component
LLAVQGVWSYERMLGIGMGYAAEPLLHDLQSIDPGRHAEATIRSAEFFNSHPYLAGLAVGAASRAEYDGVPGEQIRASHCACGPLGALARCSGGAGAESLVSSRSRSGSVVGSFGVVGHAIRLR